MRFNVQNHLVESNVGSCREDINLASKIVYDDPSVFRRLRVDEVDDDLVATCASTLKFLYASDVSLLKELAEQASRKSPDALVEEVGNKRSDNDREEKSGNHGSVEEKIHKNKRHAQS
ncbi:hypothetical protein BYT27DRAFT_6693414 [Phlegmacium glaucopus]|nr:hypothetical protein BYT27DRAFT_6693414 [Phlegmacium glaucopus]